MNRSGRLQKSKRQEPREGIALACSWLPPLDVTRRSRKKAATIVPTTRQRLVAERREVYPPCPAHADQRQAETGTADRPLFVGGQSQTIAPRDDQARWPTWPGKAGSAPIIRDA